MTDHRWRTIRVYRWAPIQILALALSILFCISTTAFASDAHPQGEFPLASEVTGTTQAAKEEGTNGFLSTVWKGLTDEAHLRVGYGVVQWKMDLKRSSDGATATMVQRDDSALFLSYGSKPTFIKDTHFGYTFKVSYVNFDMKKQDVAGNDFVNLGTEVHGYILYAVPTLYYQWGEHRYKGTFIRLGLGVGVGGARYSGTAQMSTGEVVYTKNTTFEPRLAWTNFLEANWKHIGISFSYAAPRIYGDGYDIRVAGFSLSVGYTYYF
ncbi:MAG TPA: hypothetical protein VEM40_03145 [Nitrospirota bacterium]|nr:hypothetical protein [Nitrospirota bacterium]